MGLDSKNVGNYFSKQWLIFEFSKSFCSWRVYRMEFNALRWGRSYQFVWDLILKFWAVFIWSKDLFQRRRAFSNLKNTGILQMIFYVCESFWNTAYNKRKRIFIQGWLERRRSISKKAQVFKIPMIKRSTLKGLKEEWKQIKKRLVKPNLHVRASLGRLMDRPERKAKQIPITDVAIMSPRIAETWSRVEVDKMEEMDPVVIVEIGPWWEIKRTGGFDGKFGLIGLLTVWLMIESMEPRKETDRRSGKCKGAWNCGESVEERTVFRYNQTIDAITPVESKEYQYIGSIIEILLVSGINCKIANAK